MKQSMQEEQTDAYLVLRAQADDTEAFTLLIERYQMLLLCIALRSVDDKEIARDLVQEAFLQAYLSLDQLREAAHFKNWLYGIVLNLCRNWVRTYKKGVRALTTSLDDVSWLTYYDDTLSLDPEQLFIEQEIQLLVREVLGQLSLKNRTVMQLFYYEGLSLIQIAHHLNISLPAVKSRIHKGRDQLRAHLITLYPELADMPARKERHPHMISVTLAKSIFVENIYPRNRNHGNRTILILLDEQQQRALPLWFCEFPPRLSGRVLPIQQEKEIPLESLTIDFLAQIIGASETTVEEIAIDALQRESLYARVKVRSAHTIRIVKAHLNDALPLALRLHCPLAVSEKVLSTMGMSLADWGKTLEQQLDAVAKLAVKTPVIMNYQGTLHSSIPRNLNFDDGLHGWHFSGSSAGPTREYNAQFDAQITYNNKSSLALTVQKVEPSETTGSRQAILIHEGFLANPHRGQRLRMRTLVKAQEVSRAYFEILITGMDWTPGQEHANVNMHNIRIRQKPFEGTQDWTQYELVFDVPDDASSIHVSCRLQDHGRIWINGFQFEHVEKNVPLIGTQQIFPPQHHPHNLNFTRGLENWHIVGVFAQDYTCDIDTTTTADGTASAYLKADKMEPRGSIIFMQTIDDQNYQNKRVRFSALLKSVGVVQHAGLSIKVGVQEKALLRETSIQGDIDWTRHELTLDVPGLDRSDGPIGRIDFGLTLQGAGQVWLQDIRLEIVEAQ